MIKLLHNCFDIKEVYYLCTGLVAFATSEGVENVISTFR